MSLPERIYLPPRTAAVFDTSHDGDEEFVHFSVVDRRIGELEAALWDAENELSHLRSTAKVLELRFDTVRRLHVEDNAEPDWCSCCEYPWPCPTLTALGPDPRLHRDGDS